MNQGLDKCVLLKRQANNDQILTMPVCENEELITSACDYKPILFRIIYVSFASHFTILIGCNFVATFTIYHVFQTCKNNKFLTNLRTVLNLSNHWVWPTWILILSWTHIACVELLRVWSGWHWGLHQPSGIACEGGKEKGWHMVISKMGKNREKEKEKEKTNTACFITVVPYTHHGFGKGQVLHLKMK